MSRLTGYLIVAGIVTAAPLPGQDLAQLGRRLDSTSRAAAAVRDSLAAYRKAHPPSYGQYADSITLASGKVKLLFNEDMTQVARAGAAEAEKQLADIGAGLDRVHSFVFSIVKDTATSPYETIYGDAISVRQHSAGDPANPTRTSSPHDPKSIAMVITSAVSSAVTATAASKITHWTGGTLTLTPGLGEKIDWAALRLAVVSSPSFLGKSCYLGDLRACRTFLGFDTVADPARMLYDATGRRMVVKYESERFGRASRVATQRCVDGSDEACITVLELAGTRPLASNFERGSLVLQAVDLGGTRAVERLVVTPGSSSDALAAAAGQPFDSVLASWQRHLRDRTSGSPMPLIVAISSIAWIAVCLFFALRSSRWR
jgi:hypothetical protein